MGPSTYHFVVRPQHGLVEFKAAQEPPAFLQSSIYFKCNDRLVRGKLLYTRPTAATPARTGSISYCRR